MKRNLKTVFKFLLLSAVTVVFTVLLFRIFSIRSTFEKEVGLPVDAPQVSVGLEMFLVVRIFFR
jgi:hypothetical protein